MNIFQSWATLILVAVICLGVGAGGEALASLVAMRRQRRIERQLLDHLPTSGLPFGFSDDGNE